MWKSSDGSPRTRWCIVWCGARPVTPPSAVIVDLGELPSAHHAEACVYRCLCVCVDVCGLAWTRVGWPGRVWTRDHLMIACGFTAGRVDGCGQLCRDAWTVV